MAPTSPASLDLERAFREHATVLYGFLVNAVGDRGQAEDLLQEAFVRAWRARGRFDPQRGTERSWLFQIARHLVIDDHRARERRPRDAGDESAAAAQASPGRTDQDTLDRMQLLEALAVLSPEHRQVVTAVQLDGATYKELSARTGTSVATLRSRMHYALRAMRITMQERGWTWP